jgi:hypothetical protein
MNYGRGDAPCSRSLGAVKHGGSAGGFFKIEISTVAAWRLQTQPGPADFHGIFKKAAAKADHFCKLVFE